MKCPRCQGKTKVVDSRESNEYDGSVIRRRICLECNKRFSTYEVLMDTLESGKKAKITLGKIYNEIIRGGKNDKRK